MPYPASTCDRMHLQRISLKTGITLHYAQRGQGDGQTSIFLHGYVDSWRSFAGVFAALPENFHAIGLDLRGHGDSDKPEGGYGIPDFAEDLLAFMDGLGLERANLVGHSLGSLIAQSFAAHHPDRIGQLVLISSAPSAVDNPIILQISPEVDALQDPLNRDFVAGFQAPSGPVPADFMEMIISESMKVPVHVWKAALSGLLRADNRLILHDIAAPTLLIWGKQDGIFTLGDQYDLLSQIPGSRLKEYNAGHALHWERPGELAVDLGSFLGRK